MDFERVKLCSASQSNQFLNQSLFYCSAAAYALEFYPDPITAQIDAKTSNEHVSCWKATHRLLFHE